MENYFYLIKYFIKRCYFRYCLKPFILFFPIIFLTYCNNDLDVFDDWQDKTIVYGLLNASDTQQIIRVSKSFSGEGNAYNMAQIEDSIYYSKPISVKIEEWLNGNLVKTISFHKDSSIARDSGVFAYQKNYYFVSNEPLNANAKYKLNIQIDGKTVSSETNMINSFSLLNVPAAISFSSGTLKFSIKTPTNARLIQPVLRFFYYELTATDTTKHSFDIKLPIYTTNNIEGNEVIYIEFPSIKFYESVSNQIKDNAHVIKRVAAQGSIQIITYAGSNELYAYMQVSSPSTGLSMDKPSYTNIENGLGLFTSRYTKYEIPKPLAQRTVDSLAMGVYTKHLKFTNYATTQLIWPYFP